MNLIEVIEKCSVGDYLILPGIYKYLVFDETKEELLEVMVNNLGLEKKLKYAFAINWQIERKPLVWEGEVKWVHDGYEKKVYPISLLNDDDFKVFLYEIITNNKHTKIRIEEVGE